ncbi:MAG: FAD-binding oxidoreductase [Burkholderiales bacterium]|nr:FAD-binding oxidoreductase [Burkholderiales bacterium]
MTRRHFLGQAGATLVGAASAAPPGSPTAETSQPAWVRRPALAPVLARPDRLIDIAVCTRPFRAQGPRLEAQRLGRHTIVHHYGHGGSGWSLSWGWAQRALPLILATGERRIAVVGCGAIGLTTARMAQRAGLRVRIYAQERPPLAASMAATGWWSPDSRLCTAEHASPAWVHGWEQAARFSHRMFQQLLGLPGDPVQWIEGYTASDLPFDQPLPAPPGSDPEPDYAELEGRLADLRPRSRLLEPGEHPFRAAHVRRFGQFVFNLPAYSRLLYDDFLREGGEITTRRFDHLRELTGLRERTVVNATGYGARALCRDDSLVPIRGQTARLIPQPEVTYALIYRGHNVVMVPRRDGLVVQAQDPQDYGREALHPDRAASEAAVQRLAALFGA